MFLTLLGTIPDRALHLRHGRHRRWPEFAAVRRFCVRPLGEGDGYVGFVASVNDLSIMMKQRGKRMFR
jgi:hypothetical protein